MSRWANEHAYDALVAAYSAQQNVPVEHVLATIAAESAFNPQAYRAEPQIGDASYGLMQVLLRTAQALGYSGDAAGLSDPSTSIQLGTQLLRQNFDRAIGNSEAERWDIAHAAYNSGWSAERPGDAPRKADGTFVSQAYVDRINGYVTYFQQQAATPPADSGTSSASVVSGSDLGMVGAVVGLGLLAAWFFRGAVRGRLR